MIVCMSLLRIVRALTAPTSMAGTQVPVEEPSTASETEVSVLTDHVCFAAMTVSHRVQTPSRFVLQKSPSKHSTCKPGFVSQDQVAIVFGCRAVPFVLVHATCRQRRPAGPLSLGTSLRHGSVNR